MNDWKAPHWAQVALMLTIYITHALEKSPNTYVSAIAGTLLLASIGLQPLFGITTDSVKTMLMMSRPKPPAPPAAPEGHEAPPAAP